jgi:hypothetical protein
LRRGNRQPDKELLPGPCWRSCVKYWQDVDLNFT